MEPLSVTPDGLTPTRIGLHRLAAYVIAPVRYAATGRFGLRSTPGGFGTPRFDGRRIRVDGADLIDEQDGNERRAPITTLADAAAFLGSGVDPETAAEYDSPPIGDLTTDLGVAAEASAYLGRYFEVAFVALHRVAADPESIDPSEPQLWPGHFDAAIEIGDEDHRASYGASPGDHTIEEPYLYLAAWYPDRLQIDFESGDWNGRGFSGSMLRVSEFDATRDPVEIAREFWAGARARLHT